MNRPHFLLNFMAVLVPALVTGSLITGLVSVYDSKPEPRGNRAGALWIGEAEATWDGTLQGSKDTDLEEGATCQLDARMDYQIGFNNASGQDLPVYIELSCEGRVLFSTTGRSAIQCSVRQTPTMRVDTYRYAMSCSGLPSEDVPPKPMLELNTWEGTARVTQDDQEIAVVDLKTSSRPVAGPPLLEARVHDPGFSQPLEVEGEVDDVEGRGEFVTGDLCYLRIPPFWNRHSCFIEINCADQVLLPTTYLDCEVEDGMPIRAQSSRLDLDISERRVRVFDDEAEDPWSVSISLGEPVLRDVCPDGYEDKPNGDGVDFCLLRPLVLPDADGLEAECEEMQQGVFGFRWTPSDRSRNYACPPDSKRIDDEDGTAHCRWTLPELPTRPFFPSCQLMLRDQTLGYYLGE